MAAAAPGGDFGFNSFLGRIATLGTVNTDGNGFVVAMAYGLQEAGQLKILNIKVLVWCDNSKSNGL
jgi:hypothetical protein